MLLPHTRHQCDVVTLDNPGSAAEQIGRFPSSRIMGHVRHQAVRTTGRGQHSKDRKDT